ncbi:MAG: TlyA family RNA methyltransferase [Dermatophilaceae bacterium]
MSRGQPSPDQPTRLDRELVRRGLARSRAQARELVDDGTVRVGGVTASKASASVAPDATLSVRSRRTRWVGRGGEKLAAAVERFAASGLVVRERRCLDVGASTGGFTEVLLAHGARHVVAVDVGHGQLVPALAEDARVESMPGVNIKDVQPGQLGEPFDLLVVDVSFISLGRILPVLAPLVAPDGDAVLLAKPQFELGPGRLTKAGVVADRSARLLAVTQVCRGAVEAGLGTLDVMPSPVRGSNGNQEYLLWVTPREAARLAPPELQRRIAHMEQA